MSLEVKPADIMLAVNESVSSLRLSHRLLFAIIVSATTRHPSSSVTASNRFLKTAVISLVRVSSSVDCVVFETTNSPRKVKISRLGPKEGRGDGSRGTGSIGEGADC